jgi:glycerol-3-phosphate acyltransferase PlsY
VWAALLPAAYLLGTFPSAALVARANGIDITTVGSGNPGASNVTRALGWRKGIWVFVLDALKGAIAAGVGLLVDSRPAGYCLGAAAIVGHVFPIIRRIRGGNGVATGGGVMIVLHPLVAVALMVVWIVVSRISAKASVASIAVVALLPTGVAVTGGPGWEVAASVGLCVLVMARHVGNLKRLASRTEPKLSSPT